MIGLVETTLRRVFRRLEWLFDRAFGPDWNPYYQLGALSFYLFWILTVSGLYLYIFFDTSIEDAYQSVEGLTHGQWYLGGIMRSLHRYATDAMIVTVTVHLLHEFSLGRFRHTRWFSWCTGVPLLWLLFASAIGGYWLVWDELAQYIAVVTAEWLDWLPVFSDPLARNFLAPRTLSDRLFSLLSFLHIALPLFLLLGMFIHIKRINKARINPARGLAQGTAGALVVLSLIKPAVSSPPADLHRAPTDVALDWFVLNLYPLLDRWGYGFGWALVLGITIVLLATPLLGNTRKRRVPVVRVDPANCNGCGWCFQDCPYEAIEMQPHEYKPDRRQAVVDPALCTGCTVCIGACPSATPFRSVDELITGIDRPDFPLDRLLGAVNDKIDVLQKAAGTGARILLIGCRHAAPAESLADARTAVLNLECLGHLPPSFVDYCLYRRGLEGLYVTGCGPACLYRTGAQITQARFAGQRMPHLRTRAARHRIRLSWAGPLEADKLAGELAAYRRILEDKAHD